MRAEFIVFYDCLKELDNVYSIASCPPVYSRPMSKVTGSVLDGV